MLDTTKMARLTEGVSSKSEKMRVLARSGYSRSDIANFLGVRYQFVRNVLVREADRNGQPDPKGQSGEGTQAPSGSNRVQLGSKGDIVLPEDIRSALGLNAGDTLLLSVDDGEIRLMTVPTAVRKVQAIVRQYVSKDVSLVDDLLEDRRREVDREQRG